MLVCTQMRLDSRAEGSRCCMGPVARVARAHSEGGRHGSQTPFPPQPSDVFLCFPGSRRTRGARVVTLDFPAVGAFAVLQVLRRPHRLRRKSINTTLIDVGCGGRAEGSRKWDLNKVAAKGTRNGGNPN